MEIKRTGRFEEMLVDLVQQNEDMRELVRDQIKLFRKNPEDTRLDVHFMKRRLRGKWAFDIDDDVRILFEWKGKHIVRFLAIGDHEKVYQK